MLFVDLPIAFDGSRLCTLSESLSSRFRVLIILASIMASILLNPQILLPKRITLLQLFPIFRLILYRWLDVGKKAKFCTCSPDSVRIDMGIFLKIYRPKEFEQLVDKRTEEHKKLLAAVRRDGGDTAPLEASFDPSSGLYLVNATSTDTSPSMPSPMVSPKTRPVAPPRPLTRKQPKRRAPENSTEQVPQRPKRSTEPTETVKPKRAAPCSVDVSL